MSFQTYQRFFCVGLYKIVGFMIEYVTMFAKKTWNFLLLLWKSVFINSEWLIIYLQQCKQRLLICKTHRKGEKMQGILFALIPMVAWGSIGFVSNKIGGKPDQQTLGMTLGALL